MIVLWNGDVDGLYLVEINRKTLKERLASFWLSWTLALDLVVINTLLNDLLVLIGLNTTEG